uniref:Uncharacterized protein n=1 Tax=Romanomermis culicivorax TaxID=13658 RepID=A0A915LAR4_ROMCU
MGELCSGRLSGGELQWRRITGGKLSVSLATHLPTHPILLALTKPFAVQIACILEN